MVFVHRFFFGGGANNKLGQLLPYLLRGCTWPVEQPFTVDECYAVY